MSPKVRVLLLGSTGQVGQTFRELWQDRFALDCPSRARLDLSQPGALQSYLKDRAGAFDCLINCAAYTAVDQAEHESNTAFRLNCDLPETLATACEQLNIPLIHISTDYLFDGQKTGAYRPEDAVNPQGVYGKSKNAGEEAVRKIARKHLIIRTSWVFSAYRQNFVKTMLRLGRQREQLNVVVDQQGCPTGALSLADRLGRIVTDLQNRKSDNLWGTYHLCGDEPTTWHGFAKAIFAAQQQVTGIEGPRIEAITTADYPTPASRPANSVLDCSSCLRQFNLSPLDWRKDLDAVITSLQNLWEEAS